MSVRLFKNDLSRLRVELKSQFKGFPITERFLLYVHYKRHWCGEYLPYEEYGKLYLEMEKENWLCVYFKENPMNKHQFHLKMYIHKKPNHPKALRCIFISNGSGVGCMSLTMNM